MKALKAKKKKIHLDIDSKMYRQSVSSGHYSRLATVTPDRTGRRAGEDFWLLKTNFRGDHLPLPRHSLHLLQGDPKAFPEPFTPGCPGSSSRSVGHAQKNLLKEETRGHLKERWRSSGSTPSSSQVTEILLSRFSSPFSWNRLSQGIAGTCPFVPFWKRSCCGPCYIGV